eukprot:UN10364
MPLTILYFEKKYLLKMIPHKIMGTVLSKKYRTSNSFGNIDDISTNSRETDSFGNIDDIQFASP